MFVTSRLFGDKSQHQRVGRDTFSFAGIKKLAFDLYLIVSVIRIVLLFGIAFWGRLAHPHSIYWSGCQLSLRL
jgi:hypothetical protein